MTLLALAGSFLKLGVAVTVLAGGALVLQRLRKGSEDGGPPVRTIALHPGSALHVVDVEGRRLLVGSSFGAAPRLLCELDPRRETPSR